MKGQALSSVPRCYYPQQEDETEIQIPFLTKAHPPPQIFKMNTLCLLFAHNFYKLRYLVSPRSDQISKLDQQKGKVC